MKVLGIIFLILLSLLFLVACIFFIDCLIDGITPAENIRIIWTNFKNLFNKAG